MSPSEAEALLGVPSGASVADVQHAFHRAARATHPDLMVDASDEERRAAGVRFATLREARDTLLSAHPVIPVRFEHAAPPRAEFPRRRGIGGSVVILILLAIGLVVSVSLADAYRSETVENLRGGVIQTP